MASNNTENQPPLSPPLSTRKPSTRNAIHAFFTPRHRARAPLGEVSTTSSTRNVSGPQTAAASPATPVSTSAVVLAKNVHLLSPEDSPSNRLSKKARRNLFPSDTKENFSKEPLFAEMPKSVKGKKLFAEASTGEKSAGVFGDEEKKEEKVVKERPKRIRPTTANRVLMRMLGSGSMTGARSVGGHHCLDWRYEVEGFYSRPEDVHLVYTPEQKPALPFTAAACHQNSLVGIGDESGGVRLLETEKDLAPGFSKVYLGIICHDNAVFDISWSPDDHQLATASGDQTARVFDVATQTCTNVLVGHRSSVKQAAFNPRNPSILSTCSRDGNIHIWDLRCVGTPSSLGNHITEHKPVNSILLAHSEPTPRKASARAEVSVTAVTWMINKDNTIATACEANSCIKIWDIRSTHSKRKHPLAVESSATPAHHQGPRHRPFGLNCLSLSPDGTRMYAMCRDSIVYAYSTNHISQGPIHGYTHPRLHASTFYVKCSVSPDGGLLGTGSGDGIAVVFPTDERYLDGNLYSSGVLHPEDGGPVVGGPESTTTSNKKKAGGSLQAANYLKVGKGTALVRGHEKEVTDVTWSVGGELVAISDDLQVRCWRNDDEGVKAEELRVGGEEEGRRWGWGWAEKGN
ncbi:WD40-repeat-containing domain protein [Kalaharituber pfeilii]|nr:WD40-repeat-containing domain protein [Kalaharituber pfeilii]